MANLLSVEDIVSLFPIEESIFRENALLSVDTLYSIWLTAIWIIGMQNHVITFSTFMKNKALISPFLSSINAKTPSAFLNALIKMTTNNAVKGLLSAMRAHKDQVFTRSLGDFLKTIYTPEQAKEDIQMMPHFPHCEKPQDGEQFFVEVFDELMKVDPAVHKAISDSIDNLVSPQKESNLYPNLSTEIAQSKDQIGEGEHSKTGGQDHQTPTGPSVHQTPVKGKDNPPSTPTGTPKRDSVKKPPSTEVVGKNKKSLPNPSSGHDDFVVDLEIISPGGKTLVDQLAIAPSEKQENQFPANDSVSLDTTHSVESTGNIVGQCKVVGNQSTPGSSNTDSEEDDIKTIPEEYIDHILSLAEANANFNSLLKHLDVVGLKAALVTANQDAPVIDYRKDYSQEVNNTMELIGIDITKTLCQTGLLHIPTINDHFYEDLMNHKEEAAKLALIHKNEMEKLREASKKVIDSASKTIAAPVIKMQSDQKLIVERMMNIENEIAHISTLLTCDPHRLTTQQMFHKAAREAIAKEQPPRISDPVGMTTISGSKTAYNPVDSHITMDYSDEDDIIGAGSSTTVRAEVHAAPQIRSNPEPSYTPHLANLISNARQLKDPSLRTQALLEYAIPFVKEGVKLDPTSKQLLAAEKEMQDELIKSLDEQEANKAKIPPINMIEQIKLKTAQRLALQQSPSIISRSQAPSVTPSIYVPGVIRDRAAMVAQPTRAIQAPVSGMIPSADSDEDDDPGYALFL